MAKIIFSEGEISGKLGGKVYSRNRWGPYVRELANPVNPQTSFQLSQRGILSDLAAMWRTLTSSQRLAWNGYAAGIMRTGRLGEVLSYNGYTGFMLLNSEREYVGLSALEDPPDLWLGDNPTSITFDVTAGVMTLSNIMVGAVGIAQTPAGMYLVLESCPHQSAGAEYAKTWRSFVYFNPGKVIPFAVTAYWEGRFGAIGGAGRRYFLRAYWVMAVDAPAPTTGYVSVHVGGSVLST